MYTTDDLPWYQDCSLTLEEIVFVKNLIRLEKKGKLEDLESVKQIRARDRYISIPSYFNLLQDWDKTKAEYAKFVKRDADRKAYFRERVGTNAFWPTKVARFIQKNNLSDDPEKDLFVCLRENDIRLYIEWIFEKEIFGGVIEIESPIKTKDLLFLPPDKHYNEEEYFSEAKEAFGETMRVSLRAKRLRDTLTLILSPAVLKADKILILNYFVNKGCRDNYQKYNYLTQRVWKSLLEQKNLLLLSKEKILKSYNNYKQVQAVNGGFGSIVKDITGVNLRKANPLYPSRMTKAEKERLNIWKKRLQP